MALATSGPVVRDPRLDFFRGLGMLIIFSSHMPGNWWALWIPARFGFSDATEIFVFCSGMASALAYGRLYDSRGWALGTARVGYRIWQIYWCHIALFAAIAASTVVINNLTWIEEFDYISFLNLRFFFDDPLSQLPGLLTLTYVPNYFDILPMYIVLLALIPAVLFAHHLGGTPAAIAFVVTLWLAAQAGLTGLPAEPWSDRVWFFNPFGWALVFFTGFALAAGWIRAPGYDRRLLAAAIAVVLVTLPFAYFRIHLNVGWIDSFRETHLLPWIAKTEFGILRYVHFLALAYIAVQAVGEGGRRLMGSGLWGWIVAQVSLVGQQALATFLMGMFAARIFGAIVDHVGPSYGSMMAANLGGWVLLVLTAHVVAWYKSTAGGRRPAAAAFRG